MLIKNVKREKYNKKFKMLTLRVFWAIFLSDNCETLSAGEKGENCFQCLKSLGLSKKNKKLFNFYIALHPMQKFKTFQQLKLL